MEYRFSLLDSVQEVSSGAVGWMVGSVDSSSTPSDPFSLVLFLIDAIHRLRRCLKGAFGSLARCSSLKSRAQSYGHYSVRGS
jgi:hypothetical protein